jgi:hypothetical protein
MLELRPAQSALYDPTDLQASHHRSGLSHRERDLETSQGIIHDGSNYGEKKTLAGKPLRSRAETPAQVHVGSHQPTMGSCPVRFLPMWEK